MSKVVEGETKWDTSVDKQYHVEGRGCAVHERRALVPSLVRVRVSVRAMVTVTVRVMVTVRVSYPR